MAFLGLAFIACALLIAGLPPLSGFVGKLAMLSALLDAGRAPAPRPRWTLFALLIVSGLLSTIALVRVGIRHFWSPAGPAARRGCASSRCLPIGLLLGGLRCCWSCAASRCCATHAPPPRRCTSRSRYIDAVLSRGRAPVAGRRGRGAAPMKRWLPVALAVAGAVRAVAAAEPVARRPATCCSAPSWPSRCRC